MESFKCFPPTDNTPSKYANFSGFGIFVLLLFATLTGYAYQMNAKKYRMIFKDVFLSGAILQCCVACHYKTFRMARQIKL